MNTASALDAVVGITAAAVLLFGMATAHADDNYQQFASALGNIRCLLDGRDAPQPIAMCQVGDHTYAVASGLARDQNGGPAQPGAGSAGAGFPSPFRLGAPVESASPVRVLPAPPRAGRHGSFVHRGRGPDWWREQVE